MKVICIDASEREYRRTDLSDNGIELTEGKVYTSVGQFLGYDKYNKERLGYELEEDPNTDNLYEVDRFIPLSEIDEMELVNQQLETA